MADEYQVKLFETPEEFEKWLEQNHNTVAGIWLKFAKKNSGVTSINYDQALDVALCYGWIDSQGKALDDKFYLQRYTPRGRRSVWSKINTEHVARLIKEGKMQPAGLTQVERAKADGRWDAAYDSPKNMTFPDLFLDELKKNKSAYEFFQTLNKTNTYAIAWRLQTAKKPETVKKRISLIIEMLSKKKKFH